jgi:hypothetical protein
MRDSRASSQGSITAVALLLEKVKNLLEGTACGPSVRIMAADKSQLLPHIIPTDLLLLVLQGCCRIGRPTLALRNASFELLTVRHAYH